MRNPQPVSAPEAVHPLDAVERMISSNEWSFERSDDEITIVVAGRWANYHISFTWMEDIGVLHFACAFDLKVSDLRVAEVKDLVALINGQLWVGHFDLWSQDEMMMFRHGQEGAEGAISPQQCRNVLVKGLEACEGYFPAFQFVVSAGKPAREALDMAMFQTWGEA